MSKFSNFAISFTIISILSGCLTLYSFGLEHGGPPAMIWGWVIVGGLGALRRSSPWPRSAPPIPTAGGLYYWSAKLAPGKSGPIWSWFTGWFNLLGQVAVTAGITFGCGVLGRRVHLPIFGQPDYWTDNRHVVVTHGDLARLQGLHQHLRHSNIVVLFNNVSVWWHLTGVALIVIVLFVAPHSHSHQIAQLPLRSTQAATRSPDCRASSIPFYVFLLGLLVAQYTFTGYDASAHVTEETHDAAIAGPKGIVNPRSGSRWIAGFILLIGVSAAIPHFVPLLGHHGGHEVTELRAALLRRPCRGATSLCLPRARSPARSSS